MDRLNYQRLPLGGRVGWGVVVCAVMVLRLREARFRVLASRAATYQASVEENERRAERAV